MKTKFNTLKINTPKTFLSMFLAVMCVFLMVSPSHGQSDSYYYYKGDRISLDLNKNVLNISVFKDFRKNSLDELNLKPFSLDADRSQNKASELKYSKIEFKTTPSDIQYLQAISIIEKTQDIRTVYPSYTSKEGTEIGLSDYIYIKLKNSGDYRFMQEKANEFNLTIVGQDEYMPLWYTLRCTKNTEYSSLEVANRIFETSLFASAVPDMMTYDDIDCTNDPDFNALWGLLNTTDPNADINACDAWGITEGLGINVAVLDQGIELTHIDLAGNLSPLSYDTESNTSPSLIFGDHGTHCAGTVGAVGDNSNQVVGVAPECTLFSISNSLAGTPNSRQKRADGFNWAVANGVDIISNSWGSGVMYQVIDDAIDNALQNGRGGLGCIVVFAAGNGYGSPVSYPANYTPDILAIGSIQSDGQRSNFSNIGVDLDVVAPGSSILSTVLNDGTGYKNGTSMATPHVAGLAALILSVSPCLTVQEVNDIIEQTAQKSGGYAYANTIGRPNGTWNNEMGYGLIDAHAAVLMAQNMCTSCNTTITSFPYTESFETSFGDWEQNTGDDFDWTRLSGSTSSSNTGPSSAADGSFYAYTESSSPNHPNKSAILTSPCFDLSGMNSPNLSFAYHMFGSAMGTLKLQVSDDGGASWNSIWGFSGNQGNAWQTANVDLSAYSGSVIQLRYYGQTSTSFTSDMAVDDILIVNSNCNTLITAFPYTESFETSFGAWEQNTNDDFDWTRLSGPTSSFATGPSAAADGSFYAYTESSSPNHPNKSAILTSPCFDLSGMNNPTLDFAYHMYGASMGTLKLQVSDDGGNSWNSIWGFSGDQGNAWQTASVDLSAYSGSIIQLRYYGQTSTSFQSDMAVDDITIFNSNCSATIAAFPYTESFETDFGDWEQETSDDFDWTRLSGSTPSFATGPTAAAHGSFYAYTESSSPNNPAKTAILKSPCFDLTNQSFMGMNFAYHMYGASMGTLKLQVSTNGGASWTSIWGFSGDQGNAWQNGYVNLTPYAGNVIQLRFAGQTGTSFQSDMAIDRISIGITGLVEEPGKNQGESNLTAISAVEPTVLIYPNPATDYTVVQYNTVDSDVISISVIDMLGKEVYSKSTDVVEGGNEIRLTTETFAPGTYMVRIKSNSGSSFIRKITINR